MPKLKPYTIETENGKTIQVGVSNRENANWHLRHGGQNFHCGTKENVRDVVKKLGYKPRK